MNRIWDMVYPTGVKYEPDFRHIIPTGVKYELNLRQGLPHWGKVQTKSQARFHPLGYDLPKISGIFHI